MRRLTYPLTAGIVLGCILLQAPPRTWAQQKADSETVKFETVDGVELKGTYWPGSKLKKSPVAILLHKIGGKSNEDGWRDMAEDLQKEGYAVLTFDFRGHGASTAVNQSFWDRLKFPHNVSGVKFKVGPGGALPQTITLADFHPKYLPHLVNDIAAAKRFIERRYNDPGECNASNIVLIGAEDGATLGALWLASETKRFKWLPVGIRGAANNTPESKDVCSCIWLSMSDKLGSKPMQTLSVARLLPTWIKEAGNSQISKIPMVFVYGAQQKADDKAAWNFLKSLRPKYSRDPKVKVADGLENTVDFPVAGTSLKGGGLLVSPLGTRKAIVKTYLEKVIFEDKKGMTEWEKRENNEVQYVWIFDPRRPAIFTNIKGAKHLNPIPLAGLGLNP